jgi:hypothetical protein
MASLSVPGMDAEHVFWAMDGQCAFADGLREFIASSLRC